MVVRQGLSVDAGHTIHWKMKISMNVWYSFTPHCDVAVRKKKTVKIMSYEEMLTYAKLTQFERRRRRARNASYARRF